jgi:hypothetical protein
MSPVDQAFLLLETPDRPMNIGALFVLAPPRGARGFAERLVKTMPEWDGRVFSVQVTDATDRTIQVRVLVSAGNSGKAFDLRCKMREELIAFLAREYPQALPVVRSLNAVVEAGALADAAA